MNEVDHVYNFILDCIYMWMYVDSMLIEKKKSTKTIKFNWAYLQDEETIMNEHNNNRFCFPIHNLGLSRHYKYEKHFNLVLAIRNE